MEYANIMQPEGPVIAIYKGWKVPQTREAGKFEQPLCGDLRKSSKGPNESQVGKKRAAQRHFEFVNATPDRSKEPDIQRLVKKHVRNQYLRERSDNVRNSPALPGRPPPSSVPREASRQCHLIDSDTAKPVDCEAIFLEFRDHPAISKSFGYPTALCANEYAIEMQPRTHALLSQYLTTASRRMYPTSLQLRSNPLSSPEWFKFAVTDAAMLHAMLYSGSVYLALLAGRKESEDSIYHLGQTISIVNKRLRKSIKNIADPTIGALSCLALGGAITGSQETWHIHMRGLKQIMGMRGRPSLGQVAGVGPLLLAKLQRSDIAGALDYSATPYLYFDRSNHPPIWSTLPEHDMQCTRRDVNRILSGCLVHPSLISTIVDVAHFSKALLLETADFSTRFDPAQLSEDMYWIEYRLLSFPTTSSRASGERDIDKASRLGALLYMKALLDAFPHSATGPSILLKQLQESLRTIALLESTSSLRIWLSVIGAAFSKSQTRLWFVNLLVEITRRSQISSFHDQELELSKVLSLDQVLGSSVEKLWVEVTEARQIQMTLL